MTNIIPIMSHPQNESSEGEDENESEEQPHPHDEYYEEVRGEYDEDEYGQEGEEYWYIHSSRDSIYRPRSQSTRSSAPLSQGSIISEYRRHNRKSIKRNIVGGRGYSIAAEEIQHQENQDLIDALPEDISSPLLEYWHYMEDLYYPINEKCFDAINKSHKTLLEYPSQFQEKFSKLLEASDGRSNLAELFKTDFNRVPFDTRNNEQMKPVLFRRINEFIEKLEGVTEEKYAKSKRIAYNIMSKGVLTSESAKLAKLFGILVQAETDRFADTIRFINEHYYTTLAIDLAMPNKVRWKEIMDIGLIKKKFVCEHFREQCLLREHLQEDGLSYEEGENGSSSDSDICGGRTRGKDFSQICEDEADSTPTDEVASDDSLFHQYGDEPEEIDFGDNEGKMDGEMKLSLEFDNDEFLGEGGWDAYPSHYRTSVESAETPRKSNTGEDEVPELTKVQDNEEITGGKDSLKKGKTSVKGNSVGQLEAPVTSASKITKPERKSEKLNATEKKKSSDESKKKRKTKSKSKQSAEEEEDAYLSRFEYPEEYDEELEMEVQNVETDNNNHAFFEEEEYPGEFWEGEGYDAASFRNSKRTSRKRVSSVKFDEKETYIRDFFWDSDPSKQDATTDLSKAGRDKDECTDEGYFDDDEVFDDDDVFYDRDEFFEREIGNRRKTANNIESTGKSQDLHFAIFGREADLDSDNMSLLNKLLLRWSKDRVDKKKKSKDDVADGIEVRFMEAVDDEGGDKEEGEEGEDEVGEGEVGEGEEAEDEEDGEDEEGGEDAEREDGEREDAKREDEPDGEDAEGENDEDGEDAEGENDEDGEDAEEEDDRANKSFSSNDKAFSPTTPASQTRENNTEPKMSMLDTALFEDLTDAKLHPFVNTDFARPIESFLLKLHPIPNDAAESKLSLTTVEMMQQKLPLVKCFINLQDEIWNGFEVAFREARQNVGMVISALNDVVSKAYPIEEPKDPCEEELDFTELLARGEAIKEKYRSYRHTDRTPKAHKHVHLKESVVQEELIEIEGEGGSPFSELDEDGAEDKNNLETPISSIVELVPLKLSKTSAELELMENEQHDKRSSQDSEGKKKKKVSIEKSGRSESLTKTSGPQDLGAGSAHRKHSTDDVDEEEVDNEIKSGTNYPNPAELENGLSNDIVNSTHSDARTASTDAKSVNLERTQAETDTRLPVDEIATEPNPEEKRVLRKAKHALNRENALNLEDMNWNSINFSCSVLLSAELELMENEQHDKRSSLEDSEGKKKKVSIEECGKSESLTKMDLGAGSTHRKHSTDDVDEEEVDNEIKRGTNCANPAELENGLSNGRVNSTHSDARTSSTDAKSVNLERTPAETDIRLPEEEIATEPNPEEKRILRKAKHALLTSKLQNWENALNLEAERLIRQLALIETHAQHEFCLLKQLPLYVWESSKSEAANIYMADLKRDAEIGEIFKCATKDGSPLYGKFYIDRTDLMLLLKENDPPIPLKYTDEFLELSNSLSGKKKSKKSEYVDLEMEE